MKKRQRSLLGTAIPVLILVLVSMFFVSSSSYSLCGSGTKSTSGGGRKQLSGTIQANRKQDMSVDGKAMPIKQAGVSFRRIPPSGSNPTQNKSHPREWTLLRGAGGLP